MHEIVRRYVASCHICSQTKPSREKYQGLLKPLSIPERRWKHISVDFVTELPACQGHTSVMVVICRLSKMADFTFNNTESTITKVSSFLANSKQHPRMRFKPPTDLPQLRYQVMQAQDANRFMETMSNLNEYLKSEMK